MPQQTHSARLCRAVAVPLALFSQGARATISNPGGVEHAQCAIAFSTVFGRREPRSGGTAQCPVGLEGKVPSSKAARFPGQGGLGGSVARGACLGLCCRQSGRSKLRSEEHTSELQSRPHLVCRLLLEKKKKQTSTTMKKQKKKNQKKHK